MVKRADVDKMVATQPEALASDKAKMAEIANKTPAKSKRSSDDSESENDTPAKKPKSDPDPTSKVIFVFFINNLYISFSKGSNGTPTPNKKVDIGKEAAIEAEVRAAKERAVIPLENRIKLFKEMLAEKQVSAFSTWEKELHKIVFDSR